ncbi:MAG TPA: hypothetical protein VF384_01830 [Planctomycetota bacterium]
MDELLSNSLIFFGPALLPAVAMLWAPSLGRRGRLFWAAVLGFIAVGFVVDVLVLDHSGEYTLEVPNAFGRAGAPNGHVWVVDKVTAPAWQWHITTAVFLGLAALFLFVRRGKAPAAPSPVATAVGVSAFYLAFRLALEKTAAPKEIAWAVGVMPASLLILPVFAWYCGRLGYNSKRFLKSLLYMVLLQRVLLVGVGYFATTRTLGTHLDVHVVTDTELPFFGERKFATPLEAWTWAVLVPQLTFALFFMTATGIVLGVLPWWLARRSARKVAAARPA